MKILSKLLIAILFGGLSGLIITSCDTGNRLVAPSGNSSQVSIQLVFPEEGNGGGLQKTNVINEVTVSVVDLETIDLFAGELSNKPAVLIREQALTITQTSQGRFAEGVLDIPVTGETQKFQIIVFASDFQNQLFLAGSSEIELEQGQSDAPTVTVLMGQAVSITSFGTSSASSTFTSGDFGPENGNDLDFGTSWFSAGPAADPQGSVYSWTAPSPQFIGTMGVFNNSEHDNPQNRSGFGFEKVNYKVFSGPNATGDLLFDQTIDYPKTAAEPVFRVSPFVLGQSVELTLTGHESETCGGFSELLIVNPLLSQLQSISVSPQNQSVQPGESVLFSAAGNFTVGESIDVTNLVAWSSSDSSVATIDSNGLATALSIGSTTISASVNGVTGFATLIVETVSTTGPTISNLQATLLVVADSSLCNLSQGVGNLYQFDFNYNDADGNVVSGSTVHVSFQFSPNGSSGSFDATSPTLTGNGLQGTVSTLACFLFSNQTSVDVTLEITDANGDRSNALTVNLQKPEGGNSSLGFHDVEATAAQCSEIK